MSGTKAGGIKCAITNKARHGENYYREMGKRGGKVHCKKGFGSNPELARIAGRKGGLARWERYEAEK